MNMLTSAVLVLAVASSLAAKIPSNVKLCGKAEKSCLAQRIPELLPILAKGVPEMGIPPLEPLVIPRLYVDSGTGGNFAFDINITDPNFLGIEKMIVEKANLDFDKNELEFQFKFPVMNVTGNYKSTGKILVIPINGDGFMYITFYDVTLHGIWTGTKENKKGKDHYKFTKKQFDIINKRGGGHFGNLIKGNEQLTESTNKVFNDNFETAFEEFKPSIDEALQIIVTGIINSVFGRFPIDTLFV